MATGVWKGVYPKVIGRSLQLSPNMFEKSRRRRKEKKKKKRKKKRRKKVIFSGH